MAHQASLTTERNPSARDDEKRSRPFRAVLLMAWIVLPVFFLLERVAVGAGGDGIKWLIVWLDLLLFGAVMPLVAVGRGLKVGKREPFVVAHVAITIHLFAVAASLAVIPGWNHVVAGEHWWNRFGAWLANVFTMPLWIVVVYYIASLAVALSWLIYRIDAFRADPREKDGDGQSKLEKVLKWPLGAKVRENTIEADEFAVTAIVDHPGIPISELRDSLPAIEENPGIIRGRSSIVAHGEHGGKSKVRLVRNDPHKVWRPWPGLTHPGGSYSHPISTSYYSSGEKQWYSFVRTPAGLRSRVAPDFRSPSATFKGSQGMTGAGKSGDAAIELAETFSRTNVVVVYVDTAKLLQNASWCLDFCSLAAGSWRQSGVLFKGLRKLGEFRARILGEAGVRDFDDDAAAKTGLPWVHIFADEFDVARQGDDLKWLATKGRSLGFRLSYTLPRAVGTELSTDVRAATGMWAQFGINQDYDKSFAISKETIQAGANPEQFGASVPGAHYLDAAPGIDKKWYAIDCRTYQTREDFGDLRRAVEAARATFTPADFTDGEYEVLGDVAGMCRPSVIRRGRLGMDRDDPPDAPTGATPASVLDPEGEPDMQQTMELGDRDGEIPFPETQAADDEAASFDTSDVSRAFADLDMAGVQPDPERPIRQLAPGDTGVQLVFDKPRPKDPAETVVEFDAALIRMADRGVTRFTNQDVISEMRVVPSESWVSKRFKALCDDGEHVRLRPPDGLTIERETRGMYLLVRVSGQTGTHGA